MLGLRYYSRLANRQKSKKECTFDNMALYFECQINKKRTPSYCFFGDFATIIVAKQTKRMF